MSRRTKRKLHRAAYSVLTSPAGATIHVPPGQLQGVLGQVFYGSKASIPVQNAALFSPGNPLPPQPGVDPGGKPVQFKFPFSYNTFPVDRTLGQPDIPGFEQLRRLARLYSGIGLCERYWMDLVPRMTLNIGLKKAYKDQGAEEKDYQQQIKFFKNFFAKPDGRMDLHSWIRKALRETSQIDELYVYKHRTRGGKLLGLWIVDGAQMKPILDDWGMQPEAPSFAYQQYPWGLPGMLYSSRQMIHYQESPAADSPYGFSRVERVIMEVNQALRKKKKDLANFTEGNIPQSFMEVPETPNWTPDQIDAYSQSFNALFAGNVQQQVRMLFLQPGMKYIPAEQYQMLTDFDMFLFKVSCGCYGVPPTEFGFTEDSNRSSGESQEDMVYRRTIEPIALMYASILTSCMAEDFPDELNGDMLEASFGGYEEVEDEGVKATANTTYTGAGVLGLTDAAKLGNLPIDPTAKPIGRILTTPNGPLFLDDAEFMDAWRTSAIAGFKMAANPPEPIEQPPDNTNKGDTNNAASKQSSGDTSGNSATSGAGSAPRSASHAATASAAVRTERALQPARDGWHVHRVQDSETRDGLHPAEFAHPDHRAESGEKLEKAGGAFIDVQRPPQDTETQESPDRAVGTTPGRDASGATQHDVVSHATAGLYPDSGQSAASKADYKRWRTRALEDAKAGKAQRGFTSTLIPASMHGYISQLLHACRTADEVRAVFNRAQAQEAEIAGSDQALVYNAKLDIWEPDDTEQQLERMRVQGVKYLRWQGHASNSGVCPLCDQNVGQVVPIGEPFKSGHRLPQCHIRCQCSVDRLMEKPIERAVEPVSSISKKGTCDCEECRAMDGKPVGEKKPPYHDGCDCEVTERD